MTGLCHPKQASAPRAFRILAAILVSATLVGCGVKTDLEIPNGALPQKEHSDPSKPPQPLGQ